MYFDDHKRIATMISSRRNSNGEPKIVENVPMQNEVVKDEGGMIDGKHIAAQEIMGAIHSKSPMQLMEALSHFITIHHSAKDAMVDHE
jgi:hypothetical protein